MSDRAPTILLKKRLIVDNPAWKADRLTDGAITLAPHHELPVDDGEPLPEQPRDLEKKWLDLALADFV